MKDEKEFIFENLDVYKESLALAIQLCQIASGFPIKYQRIRDQLIGAVISIPLNIAEGNGRRSGKDKINFLNVARSSAFECIPTLEICNKLELIRDEDLSNYRNRIVKISKMISGLISFHHK